MRMIEKEESSTAPVLVREYKIGNTTYVVKAHSKNEATEDAVTKIKRLIKNDIQKLKAN